MGYITEFDLVINDKEIDRIEEYFNSQPEYSYIKSLYRSGNHFYLEGKWYDHQDDMRFVSKQFPEVLFRLEGRGENREDLWVEYYLDGKVQTEEAKITYNPFDKEKLA